MTNKQLTTTNRSHFLKNAPNCTNNSLNLSQQQNAGVTFKVALGHVKYKGLVSAGTAEGAEGEEEGEEEKGGDG